MKGELIAFEQPNSPIAEAFRGLRTNIQLGTNVDNLKTIMVASIDKHEGKSWVASNLAISFAKNDEKVILIDVDMRAGRQHTIFETAVKKGVSDYLLNKNEPQLVDYVKNTVMPNLKLITCGKCPQNPTELLLTKRLDNLLEEAKSVADLVIIDALPTTMIADTLVMAKKVDGIVLVIEQGRAKSDDLKKAIRDIHKVGGEILGIVLNKVPHTRKTYSRYSYYGDSKDLEETNRKRK